MDMLRAWMEAARNAFTRYLAFPLCLLLILYALLKIKVRRPRYEFEEELPDEEPLSREEQKGRRGEDIIAKILYDTTPGEFQIFRNVYVPNGNTTAEIDLLMVHEAGIFVFESKNYTGLISGSMDALNWVHIHPNRKKYTFYNPVRQNRTHIRALSRYLRIPEKYFYSYVVFSKRCKLERVPENTRSVIVTQTTQLEARIEDTLWTCPALYDAAEIQAIADRLIPLTNVDLSVKRKHVSDIRDAQESDTCPWCGGKLVTRRGKYGTFLGCSSYPKCTFKRNLMR